MSVEPNASENGNRIWMEFFDFRGIFNMTATRLDRHEIGDEWVLIQQHFAGAE
jgi:hypothetical protein